MEGAIASSLSQITVCVFLQLSYTGAKNKMVKETSKMGYVVGNCLALTSYSNHRLKRKGLATEHPRKYHPCFAPVLIEAYFQRGS